VVEDDQVQVAATAVAAVMTVVAAAEATIAAAVAEVTIAAAAVVAEAAAVAMVTTVVEVVTTAEAVVAVAATAVVVTIVAAAAVVDHLRQPTRVGPTSMAEVAAVVMIVVVVTTAAAVDAALVVTNVVSTETWPTISVSNLVSLIARITKSKVSTLTTTTRFPLKSLVKDAPSLLRFTPSTRSVKTCTATRSSADTTDPRPCKSTVCLFAVLAAI
jgi:hypothetical protein